VRFKEKIKEIIEEIKSIIGFIVAMRSLS